MPGNAWHILKHSIYFIKFLIMSIKTFSIPTCTALYLMVMLMLTIFTSVAVAQTPITTIEQLNNVRNDLTGSYVLMNDLDFADGPIAYRPQSTSDATVAGPAADATNAGFAPIWDSPTQFTGTFDGNGFTISNLYINRTSTNNIGLFGVVGSGGEVKNVGLVDAYVKGNNPVGGLVGNNVEGTITNSYTTGNVSGTTTTGGLTGQNFNGTIRNCFATATVTGTTNTGGLVGENFGGTITNCYTTGNASGTNTLGGLVGLNTSSSNVTNCYATGNITTEGIKGGLAGSNSGTITNSFWDTQTTGQSTGIGGEGATQNRRHRQNNRTNASTYRRRHPRRRNPRCHYYTKRMGDQ